MASVPGTFVYNLTSGTVLNVGAHVLHVNFTPTDSVNYNNASKSVTINVTKATPTIKWSKPEDITFGTALNSTQLNASASVNGTFTYNPITGTVLSEGTHVLYVYFTPTDSVNYINSSKNVTINVTKATPTIKWNNPADITYGTALNSTQLNASASLNGTFTYNPPSGTILNAGTKILNVEFTPTDTTNYTTASKNVTINVTKAAPTITWSNPVNITYGTVLNSSQLNASASVPGTFTYTPLSGIILSAGMKILNVDFTPTDAANYTNTSKNVTINVTKASPTITWNDPANITYGTALNSTQLNASASVNGTFVYNPITGTVLSAGTKILSVVLTPTDDANYTNTSKNVTINVTKASPTITWSNPANITYGTALNSTQLNASASVNGTFVYNPITGTVLSAGTKILSVVFTPMDAGNYTNVSKNVTINVTKATPIITWTNPASIFYGTALSSAQLNASCLISGTFVYTPTSGTVLSAGTQTLHVDFTPTDTTNYTGASKNVTINVLKAYAYITNSNSNNVSVIDTGTNTVTATVSGFDLSNPAGVAVTSDGTKVYVTNSGTYGVVSVIDTATNNITGKINVGNSPWGIAVNRAGTKVYVAHQQGSRDVYVINATSNIVEKKVTVGINPTGIAVTPDGTKVYVTNSGRINTPGKTVSVINTSSDTITATVNVGNFPFGVAINPVGTKVYVTNAGSNTVSVIDITSNIVTATVPVGNWPEGVAVTPDGTKIYVTNYDSNSVSVINTATNNVIATVNVGSSPTGVAINGEGTKVYVANSGDNTISVIDTTTHTVMTMVNVGESPIAFGQFIVHPP
jgi:YVTN family beta-propeller protein